MSDSKFDSQLGENPSSELDNAPRSISVPPIDFDAAIPVELVKVREAQDVKRER